MKYILAKNADEELSLFRHFGANAYYSELGTLGEEGNVEYHFDHHGVRADKPTALSQAIDFVKLNPDFPEKPVVIGMPLDLDCACTALILSRQIQIDDVINHLPYHEYSDKYGIHIANRIVGTDRFWNALMILFGKLNRELSLDAALLQLAHWVTEKDFDAASILHEFQSKVTYKPVAEAPELGFIAVISSQSNPFFKLYESYDIVSVYNSKTRWITIGTSYTVSLPSIHLPAQIVDLTDLFKRLDVIDRPGWGGRANIGGSPKGVEYSENEFEQLAIQIKEVLPELMKPSQ